MTTDLRTTLADQDRADLAWCDNCGRPAPCPPDSLQRDQLDIWGQ